MRKLTFFATVMSMIADGDLMRVMLGTRKGFLLLKCGLGILVELPREELIQLENFFVKSNGQANVSCQDLGSYVYVQL